MCQSGRSLARRPLDGFAETVQDTGCVTTSRKRRLAREREEKSEREKDSRQKSMDYLGLSVRR